MSRLVLRRRARRALGTTAIEYPMGPPPPPPPPPVKRGVLANKTRSLAPYAFGDDAAPMTEVEWREKMLAQQSSMTSWLERWVKRDELQRWLQIGATLAIPLSAAIWRAIFRATRRED